MPKVYDKDGRELTVGAPVRDTLIHRPDGEVVAIGWAAKSGWVVRTQFPDEPRPSTRLAYAHAAEDSWRTPGLCLIDPPVEAKSHTKEAASAAPEGAER